MRKSMIHGIGALVVAFLLPLLSLAQKPLTGKVLSKTDQSPVPGATVSIKGSRIGTSTAVDGSFVIKANMGDVLVVSGIGIGRQEQKVDSGNFIILVSVDARELNQVVVTATGIKKEARRLGYSLQTVDASTMTQAREPDPINALKGNVAGLAVNITPEIGHSSEVIIRGENAEDDRPIFVVDGVPINSDTYNMNADDIESYTILKGPNAAALYGFQGKNGAIIINTKKGAKSKGKTVVSFNSSTQFNKGFIALPKYQDTYGPGDNGKYAYGGGGSSADSYFGNGVIGTGTNDYDYDVWGPQFRGQDLPQYDGDYDPTKSYTTTFADGTTYIGHVQPTTWVARGKDNLRRFIQTGLLSTNSISISSSSEKTDMRFSLANSYQKGIVPNTQLNNFNLTANITHRLNDKFSISPYINFSRQSTPNVPDVDYGPNSIIYNIILWGGADWSMSEMRDYWEKGKVGLQQKYAEHYRYNNPWFMSYEWLRGHYQNNVYGYISMNYKLNPSLEIQFRPSATLYDMFNDEKMPYSAGAYGRELRQGDYREDRRSQFEVLNDLQVRYHRNEIAGFLDLSGVGGLTARNFSFNSNFESTNYLNTPGTYSFSNSQGNITGVSYNSKMTVLSAYYSVDLGYKSYVTANITGRVDKSSALPSNANSYFYPSFNLASVISEYVKMPEPISFFKVRASYAETKSGGTGAWFTPNVTNTPAGDYGYVWKSPYNGPNYPTSKTYTLSPTYSSQVSAVYTTTAVDPNIITAQRKATEFGVDLRFLKNRLGLDVTRFHYWNKGIVNQSISSSTGYSGYRTNGDIYTNDGWEVVINGSPIVNPKGLSWNVTGTFSNFKKVWKNYVSGSNNWVHNGTRTDLVYGQGYVRTPDGQLVIDNSGTYMRMSSEGGSTGQRIFGHADPDFTWGLVNTFSYKDFAIRFQFDGMVGGVMEDYVRKKTLQAGRHSESASGAFGVARPYDEAGVDAYLGKGVNLSGATIQLDPVTGEITNMKDLTVTDNVYKSQVQAFVTRMANLAELDIVKKTYVKLREVTLSYKLPTTLFGKKPFITGATVSAVGRNLLYFFNSKFKDLDVDQYSQDSGSGLQTPTTRSYGFNVNLTF